MVYCCFNGSHKIHRFTFDRWLSVLAQVPGSVLWLLGSTDTANQRLRDYAAEHGIDASRLVFADKLANPAHLLRYELADLFLDTTPYGAHTTASDALWMGVPVLTLSGRSFASRVCGSLVRAAGLEELCCTSAARYVEMAVAFGRDRASLAPLRERLREAKQACVLFDMPLLTRELEGLYGRMWEDFRQGALPRPDLANLDVYLEIGRQNDHEQSETQLLDDYQGWWMRQLEQRHRFRPVPRDRRLAADPERFA